MKIIKSGLPVALLNPRFPAQAEQLSASLAISGCFGKAFCLGEVFFSQASPHQAESGVPIPHIARTLNRA